MKDTLKIVGAVIGLNILWYNPCLFIIAAVYAPMFALAYFTTQYDIWYNKERYGDEGKHLSDEKCYIPVLGVIGCLCIISVISKPNYTVTDFIRSRYKKSITIQSPIKITKIEQP